MSAPKSNMFPSMTPNAIRLRARRAAIKAGKRPPRAKKAEIKAALREGASERNKRGWITRKENDKYRKMSMTERLNELKRQGESEQLKFIQKSLYGAK